LALFNGDEEKVAQLETLIAAEFGFTKVLPISGQTYSRKLDMAVLNSLQSFAVSAHKMATDLRLLAHLKEITEPFEEEQVGSSAMPYKKNPILAERICGLARFVMSLAQNPVYTAATQWLERSLDDSSNRRLAVPEAFLGADAILQLLASLLPRLVVNVEEITSHLHEELPLLVMENILMAAVQRGGNRQTLHESLRKISLAAQKHSTPLEFLISQIERGALLEGGDGVGDKEADGDWQHP
jgi:adenylosuccinate lyase